jgi:DNA-binding NtrC family response regulator
MELRRQDPWAQGGRIPPSVVAGNQAPSWAPPGASCSEGLSLPVLGAAFVAVADDNHHHRAPLLRALRASGHEVLHAPGPRTCERLIQDSTHKITALVCCAQMEEMSGFELARRVIQGRPDIRVLLILRDSSDSRAMDRASALGYAHASQSTSVDEVCSVLARLLGSADARERIRHSDLIASRI